MDRDSKYTYDDFILSVEMSNFFEKLSQRDIFSRGLPLKEDLKGSKRKFVESLREVLEAPSRYVLVKDGDDRRGSKLPLRRCLELGWLFSDEPADGMVRYRFASRLHEMYTEWLLA